MPVREVLRAAALLGTDFAVADLAIVLGRSVADLIPAVDEACAVGVLAESGDSLGFRHPLIRAALYDDMPAPVRAAWHRDAGRALAEADAPPTGWRGRCSGAAKAARPAGLSTEPMDEWMLDWLARTADPLVGRRPGSRSSSSRGQSPVPPPARPSTAGWPAGCRRPLPYR